MKLVGRRSNDSLEQTGRPAALPRPKLRLGRPRSSALALDAPCAWERPPFFSVLERSGAGSE